MSPVPIVRVSRRGSVVIDRQWRTSPAYHAYRRRVTTARSYAGLVDLLETLTDPTSAALDFAPHADYARRFLNTTVAYRSLPSSDPRRHLAERAVRALVPILVGASTRGRPHAVPVACAAAVLQSHRQQWLAAIQRIWRMTPDVTDRLAALAALGTPHTRKLRPRVLARTRPSALATELTAWDLHVPVRAVRAAVRHYVTDDVTYG